VRVGTYDGPIPGVRLIRGDVVVAVAVILTRCDVIVAVAVTFWSRSRPEKRMNFILVSDWRSEGQLLRAIQQWHDIAMMLLGLAAAAAAETAVLEKERYLGGDGSIASF
jgi:hypothetical protein